MTEIDSIVTDTDGSTWRIVGRMADGYIPAGEHGDKCICGYCIGQPRYLERPVLTFKYSRVRVGSLADRLVPRRQNVENIQENGNESELAQRDAEALRDCSDQELADEIQRAEEVKRLAMLELDMRLEGGDNGQAA